MSRDSSGNKDDTPSSSWWPFSSSSPASSSWQEQWQEFHDSQRLERLSTCLQLDQILKQCRQRKLNKNDDTDDPLEKISPGLRTMKYYGWRGILTKLKASSDDAADDANIQQQTQANHDDTTAFHQALHDQIKNSCSREQHAVWACRAVATGCGKQLAHLKKCFEDEHPNEQEMILVVPHTNYDNQTNNNSKEKTTTLDSSIPCYKAQQSMGACITANATSLLERKQKREAAAATLKS